MGTFTKKTLTMTFIQILTSSIYIGAVELNPQTIPRYVDHTVDHLMGINNQYDHHARNDIRIIKEEAVQTSQKPTVAERLFSLEVQRTTNQVEENVFSSIIDFVEKQSYRYAWDKTNNARVAQKVSKKIRTSLEKQITQTGEFKPGALAEFIGNALFKKVSEECNRFDIIYPYQPKPIECPICWEDFAKSACVALYPCGHYVCKKCAENFFIIRQGNPRCPQCIRLINVDVLRNNLYAPSAPPMD